jgi:hypothetical protein
MAPPPEVSEGPLHRWRSFTRTVGPAKPPIVLGRRPLDATAAVVAAARARVVGTFSMTFVVASDAVDGDATANGEPVATGSADSCTSTSAQRVRIEGIKRTVRVWARVTRGIGTPRVACSRITIAVSADMPVEFVFTDYRSGGRPVMTPSNAR